MSELLCIARLKIHHGKLDELKRLCAACLDVVRTKDRGTLQYDTYIEGNEAVVIERYRDSESLLEHHQHLGDLMAKLLEICTGEGEILGTASAALRAQVQGGPVRILSLHSSLP